MAKKPKTTSALHPAHKQCWTQRNLLKKSPHQYKLNMKDWSLASWQAGTTGRFKMVLQSPFWREHLATRMTRGLAQVDLPVLAERAARGVPSAACLARVRIPAFIPGGRPGMPPVCKTQRPILTPTTADVHERLVRLLTVESRNDDAMFSNLLNFVNIARMHWFTQNLHPLWIFEVHPHT